MPRAKLATFKHLIRSVKLSMVHKEGKSDHCGRRNWVTFQKKELPNYKDGGVGGVTKEITK